MINIDYKNSGKLISPKVAFFWKISEIGIWDPEISHPNSSPDYNFLYMFLSIL